MVRCAHPVQALATALVLAAAALLSGRPWSEVALVLATVLVGQVVLGWQNDIMDRTRDREAGREDKPLAQDRVEPSSLAFWTACGVLLVVPLAISNGTAAGVAYLLSLLAAGLYNVGVLRRTRFSFVPWAVSFGLLPAFLSYGGWGGGVHGAPPTIVMTVLVALLGIGVHVLLALPHLVSDNKAGVRQLPLRLAMRTGAPRLLVLSAAWTVLVSATILIAALTTGSTR